jgi:PKD repeat protein
MNVGRLEISIRILTVASLIMFSTLFALNILNARGQGCNLSPVAQFSYSPAKPKVCDAILFDASASYDPDGFIIHYSWDFGDGNTTEVGEPLVVHQFLVEGLYTVELNVTDSMGLWDATSRTVNVTKPLVTPPTAIFTWTPTVPEAGESVSFDASASAPNGGEIVLYLWDFGDGMFGNSSTPFIMHTYESFGNYTVVLNITDSEGQSGTTANVVTVIEKPIADFFFFPENIRVCTAVTFNGSISDSRGGHVVQYAWDFGDNSSILYGMTVVHHFRKMREFTVSLNVTDSEGKWDVKTVTLKVLPHIADLNEDGVVDIQDLTIFGLAFGSYPGDERWDARADLVKDETINIQDGVLIAIYYDPCAVYVDP